MDERLPPELWSVIFSKLRELALDDPQYASKLPKDLGRCSLVSKQWCALAQENLFRSIRYSFRRTPQNGLAEWANLQHGKDGRWGQHFGEKENVPYKTLEMFVSFLRAHPHITRRIQQLSLVCFPSEWRFSRTANKYVPVFGSVGGVAGGDCGGVGG